MILAYVIFVVGVLSVFAGVGMILVGTTQKKKNYVIAGAVIPLVTWLSIIAWRFSPSFPADWP